MTEVLAAAADTGMRLKSCTLHNFTEFYKDVIVPCLFLAVGLSTLPLEITSSA